MPVLVRMYVRHILIGFVLSVVFTGLLFWLNVGNLWHLVNATSGGAVAVVMLLVFNTIVFSGVQFGIAVMQLGEDDDAPKRGHGVAVPVAVPAKAVGPSGGNRAVAGGARSTVCFSASNSAMHMASTAVASRKASRLRLTQLSPPSLVSAWKSTATLVASTSRPTAERLPFPKTTWVERKSVTSCSSPPSGGEMAIAFVQTPSGLPQSVSAARVAAELMHSLECLLGNRLRRILSQ